MAQSAREILEGCYLFRNVSETALGKLADITVVRRYARGREIFHQGDACPGIFVVGSGSVRVVKVAPGGKEHVLHQAGPGMTFAEVAAIGAFPCPANAEALEDSVCGVVVQDRLNRLLDEDHALCRQLMGGFAGWVRHLIGLLEDIVLRDAAGRVARHLLEAGARAGAVDFSLPMLKKDLASHLNLTSETLSRTLRRLAEAGMIALPDVQNIRILKPDLLAEVADGLPPGEFD